MMEPRYPAVKVKLIGEDGNVFFILARCLTEMKKNGLPREEGEAFLSEAISGDYDHALRTVMKWFEVE